MSNRAPIIETAGLTKYYGVNRGIEDLDLTVRAGEILGFLGPNGAGKTTTIRLLLGLIGPTSGRGAVMGQIIGEATLPIRDRIGYIPGDVRLYPRMTGAYLLDYFSCFKPARPAVLRDELVKRFDLDLSKRVGEYSRGNRQKLAVVLAMMHDPKLLILDEPTLGLDPMMQREFYLLLREFRDRGAAVFLSTHILGEVEPVCDRAAVVRNGRLIAVEDVAGLAGKKLHVVEATLGQEVPAHFFDLPGVTALQKQGRTTRLMFKGELDPLIKRLAQTEVVALSLTHAGLEDVFFEFYEKPAGEGSA